MVAVAAHLPDAKRDAPGGVGEQHVRRPAASVVNLLLRPIGTVDA